MAIDCLLNALKLEPNNLKALMALSVSLTNETQPNRACYMLEVSIKVTSLNISLFSYIKHEM